MPQKKRSRIVARKSKKTSPPQKSRKIVAKATVIRQRPIPSECAMMYGASLANPFTGPMACIPDYPVLKSRRVRYFVRGSFNVSTTSGVGGLVYTPEGLVANDNPGVYFSAIANVNSTTPDPSLGTPNTPLSATSNSEFTTSEIGSSLSYRVVSSGVRIRYIGTELNRGGQVICLAAPNHETLSGFTEAQLLSYDFGTKLPVDRRWINLVYHPVDGNDLAFQATIPTAANAQGYGWNYMAILVLAPGGLTTPSCPMEFEVYTNFELVGKLARGIQNSEADPAGFAAVNTASSSSNELATPFVSNNPGAISGKFLDLAMRFYSDINQAVGQSMNIGAKAAGAAFGTALGSGVLNYIGGRNRV